MEPEGGRSRQSLILPLFTLTTVAMMLASLWSSIGPGHPAFVFCVALLAFGSAVFMGGGIARRVPDRFFYISEIHARLFKFLGVRIFDGFLTLIAWNALISTMRHPVTEPRDLARLAQDLKSSATAHACGFLIHATTATLALFDGTPITALWLVLTAVPLHLYPTMLQLLNLRRIGNVPARRA